MQTLQTITIAEDYREGKRFYSCDGFSVPSVTSVLGATRDNTFLDKWALANPGEREAAADRGSAVHKAIENFLMGEGAMDTIHEHYSYFKSVLPFLKNFSPLFMEVPIFSKVHGFAGRVDCGGIYGGEIPIILDWKTSKKHKKSWYDYPLQLAAYLHGFRETYPDYDIDFNHTLIVCATPQGAQIEMFDLEQINYYWGQFKRRLETFYAARREVVCG